MVISAIGGVGIKVKGNSVFGINTFLSYSIFALPNSAFTFKRSWLINQRNMLHLVLTTQQGEEIAPAETCRNVRLQAGTTPLEKLRAKFYYRSTLRHCWQWATRLTNEQQESVVRTSRHLGEPANMNIPRCKTISDTRTIYLCCYFGHFFVYISSVISLLNF